MLNGEKYRKQIQDEMRKARNRRAQATYRAKHNGTPPNGREKRFVEAHGNGDDAGADRIAAEGLK